MIAVARVFGATLAASIFGVSTAHADGTPRYSLEDGKIVIDAAGFHDTVTVACDKTFALAPHNGRLHVACGAQGIVVYSLADPRHPYFSTRLLATGSCESIGDDGWCATVAAQDAATVPLSSLPAMHVAGARTFDDSQDAKCSAKRTYHCWSSDYHGVTRPHYALIVPGAAMFVISYGVSIGIAAANASNYGASHDLTTNALFIPIVGPFAVMATFGRSFGNCGSSCGIGVLVELALAIDGLAQAAGLLMFVVGLANPKKVSFRNVSPSVRLTPTFDTNAHGASLGIGGAF